MSRLKRRGERTLPCTMPESTQGEDTEPRQGAAEEVGEEVPETARDTEVKETNQSGFDPARVKSLFDVDEHDKGVLVAAEAQGVHEAEGQSVGTSGRM